MAVRASKVDDDDLLELIMNIQDDFGVRFSDEAFQNCANVGEVFDVVWAGLPDSVKSGGKCPSQMAFYRLRAAVADRTLSPNASLNEINGLRYIELRRTLAKQGWDLPGRTCAPATWRGSYLTALATATGLWSHVGPVALLWAFGAFVATMTILHLKVFTSTGPEAATVGELAREMTALNGGKLLRRGASFTRPMLWDRFVRTLRDDATHGQVLRESGFYSF